MRSGGHTLRTTRLASSYRSSQHSWRGFLEERASAIDPDRPRALAVPLSSYVTLGEFLILSQLRVPEMLGKQCPPHRLQVRSERDDQTFVRSLV